MDVIVRNARAETVVKNSRFIAELFPVQSQAQAREQLYAVKQNYTDATHVVHAFIVGEQAQTQGMSDDGEPSGTAGRPVLDVLRGSGVTNVLLTVTRYFGGTLLGTGGLVHAYSDAAKQVLACCHRELLVAKVRFSFTADYAMYENIKRCFGQYHVGALEESYASAVSIAGTIWQQEVESFGLQIQNISKGTVLMNCGEA